MNVPFIRDFDDEWHIDTMIMVSAKAADPGPRSPGRPPTPMNGTFIHVFIDECAIHRSEIRHSHTNVRKHGPPSL
jgi:hypothetical protein